MTETCPSDFDRGIASTCLARCPFDFEYRQASGGIGGRCVSRSNPDLFVELTALPRFASNTAEPSAYRDERQRFNREINRVRSRVQALEAARSEFSRVQGQNVSFDGQVTGAESQFAGYNIMTRAADTIKSVTDSIRRPRQPVAPRKDIDEERRRILSIVEKRVQLLQVALITVLICLVIYFVLPTRLAHGVAFLTACVGSAVGIFLTST
jgi:hypothetical protein